VKRAVLFLGLLLPLVAAGCGPAPAHVEGFAAPVTSHSAAVPPSAAGPPTVLGPTGFGTLRLGMTKEKATATGLVERWPAAATGCEQNTFLTSAPGGERGRVYLDDNDKIQIIDGYPGVRTPEGVEIGTSKSALLRAYPGWRNVVDNDPDTDGRGLVAVPGNSKAEYRIVTEAGKVTELTLQYRNQTCYE
jgi:hypothetical protein